MHRVLYRRLWWLKIAIISVSQVGSARSTTPIAGRCYQVYQVLGTTPSTWYNYQTKW